MATPIAYLEAMGCTVVTGAENDVYDARHDVIALTDATAYGHNTSAWLSAMHELSHWRQRRERPWLFFLSWFLPARWFAEVDAWRRARDEMENGVDDGRGK